MSLLINPPCASPFRVSEAQIGLLEPRITKSMTPGRMKPEKTFTLELPPRAMTPSCLSSISSFDYDDTVKIPPRPMTPSGLSLASLASLYSLESLDSNMTVKTPPKPTIPKIAQIKVVEQQEENDPWIKPKVVGSDQINITSMTPIGTVRSVPTTKERPKTSVFNSTMKSTVKMNVVNQKDDAFFNAAIYLDCTKNSDRSYDYVANKMKSLSAVIDLQKQYVNELKPLIKLNLRREKINLDKFDKLLSIYENNQVYYQDRLDDKSLPLDVIKQELRALENWFVEIPEPKPEDPDEFNSWQEREQMRLMRKISPYCDPSLHCYL